MTDKLLQAMFIVAALVLVVGGFARADTLADMERGVAEDMAYARSLPNDAPTTYLPNPPASAYQPPLETTMQNFQFQGNSYRCGGCY